MGTTGKEELTSRPAAAFQPAATRCQCKARIATHCQLKAWLSIQAIQAPSLPTRTTPCRPGSASLHREESAPTTEESITGEAEVTTTDMAVPTIQTTHQICSQRAGTSNPLTTGR